jgi:hypothetical protein
VRSVLKWKVSCRAGASPRSAGRNVGHGSWSLSAHSWFLWKKQSRQVTPLAISLPEFRESGKRLTQRIINKFAPLPPHRISQMPLFSFGWNLQGFRRANEICLLFA